MIIRAANLGDIFELDALEKLSFDYDQIPRQEFYDLIASEKADVIVTKELGRLTGYGIMQYPSKSRFAWLYSLVSTDHKGNLILNHLETLAKHRRKTKVYLEVKIDNDIGIRFYEREGYVKINKIEGFYTDGTAALRFRKEL